jgi:hypothetical protein
MSAQEARRGTSTTRRRVQRNTLCDRAGETIDAGTMEDSLDPDCETWGAYTLSVLAAAPDRLSTMTDTSLQRLHRIALAALAAVVVAYALVSTASATRESMPGEAPPATTAEPERALPLERTPPSGTELRLFAPYSGGRLASCLVVAQRLEGRCFARSVASPARPDAWRCEVDSAILDPCFLDVMGDPDVLACARDPFEGEVLELVLVEALPETPSPEDPRYELAEPWTLVVDGGVFCTLFTGATGPVAGLRISYGCDDGSSLLGAVDRAGEWWRIFRLGAERRPSIERVRIVEAWF